MTVETVLTNDQIIEQFDLHIDDPERFRGSRDFARAIEQAVLQSPEVHAWKRDVELLDWLADPKNSIGDVQLPTECVERNPHSLRDAIEDAMEKQK